MNKLYYDNLLAEIKNTLNKSESVSNVKHALTKGAAREIFVSNLLKPFLSLDLDFSNGIIIDSQNNQSNEVDIIIYNPNVVPPFSLNKIKGFIPFESVVATIQVKSIMNKEELKSSIINAISIKKLKANWKSQILPPASYINSPLCCVFAFKTDLTKKNDYERFIETYEELKNSNELHNIKVPISCFCVSTKLAFKCLNANADPPRFVTTFNNKNYEAVIDFLIYLIDGCNVLKKQRSEMFLSDYIR